MRKFFLLTISVVSLVFLSCKKYELVVDEAENEMIKVKTVISELGFNTEDLKIIGDNIFVEDDIVFKKSKLLKTTPRQAVFAPNQPGVIIPWGESAYRLISFKYYISNGLSDHASIDAAINEFNAVFVGIVVPTRVYNESDADLVINSYTEFSNTCGYAEFPTVGLGFPPSASPLHIGSFININTFHWGGLSSSQRKFLIAHEMGHAIGIRHTNWRALSGDPEYFSQGGWTYGAYTVPNTNNTSLNPDSKSVFNGNSCGNSWNGFTGNDKRAIWYVVTGGAL